MNPGRFFVEVLESHKFRRSDRFLVRFGHASEYIFFVSDNANLLDTVTLPIARRIVQICMAQSAAAD